MSPLQDIRVLVTRSRHQASSVADLLRQRGATPILIPTLEIAPPQSWDGLDEALASDFEWSIFTSANAVHALADRAAALQKKVGFNRIAVIGPATGQALQECFARNADLMPQTFVAEALAESLLPFAQHGAMLLVRAAVAGDALPEILRAAGAKLTIAEAYRNVVPSESLELLQTLFRDAPPDAILFTSASTARNLTALMQQAEVTIPSGTKLVSIGPVTTAAMRELSLNPTIEATQATIPALVDALEASLKSAASDS